MNEDIFEQELMALINKHSLENIANIPDFIIAEHLIKSLNQLNDTFKSRDSFLDYKPFKDKITIKV